MKNKCQVKFLHTGYVPTNEEMYRLLNLQYELGFCRTEIMNQCKDDKYNQVLRMEQLSRRLRDRWEVIQGNKEETEENPLQSAEV